MGREPGEARGAVSDAGLSPGEGDREGSELGGPHQTVYSMVPGESFARLLSLEAIVASLKTPESPERTLLEHPCCAHSLAGGTLESVALALAW